MGCAGRHTRIRLVSRLERYGTPQNTHGGRTQTSDGVIAQNNLLFPLIPLVFRIGQDAKKVIAEDVSKGSTLLDMKSSCAVPLSGVRSAGSARAPSNIRTIPVGPEYMARVHYDF